MTVTLVRHAQNDTVRVVGDFGSNPVGHHADKYVQVGFSPAIGRSLLARYQACGLSGNETSLLDAVAVCCGASTSNRGLRMTAQGAMRAPREREKTMVRRVALCMTIIAALAALSALSQIEPQSQRRQCRLDQWMWFNADPLRPAEPSTASMAVHVQRPARVVRTLTWRGPGSSRPLAKRTTTILGPE